MVGLPVVEVGAVGLVGFETQKCRQRAAKKAAEIQMIYFMR